MAAPFANLTPEQRANALARATEVRREQADIKLKLKNRELSLPDVINLGDTNAVVAKMKVFQLIKAMPTIGPAKARVILDQCGIAEVRRVHGLTPRQRAALVDTFPG